MTNTHRRKVHLPQASASFSFSSPFNGEDGTFSEQYGVTTQKTAQFIVTAVRTSNPTHIAAFFYWFLALITAWLGRSRSRVVGKATGYGLDD
jgi:hypothetical protein